MLLMISYCYVAEYDFIPENILADCGTEAQLKLREFLVDSQMK